MKRLAFAAVIVIGGSLFAQDSTRTSLRVQVTVVPVVQSPAAASAREFSIPVRPASVEVKLVRADSPDGVLETTVVVPK